MGLSNTLCGFCLPVTRSEARGLSLTLPLCCLCLSPWPLQGFLIGLACLVDSWRLVCLEAGDISGLQSVIGYPEQW